MFLLFGTRVVLRHLATVRFACRYCGRTVPQEVFERANRFTLFFLVPLFTYGRSYVNRCTNCGGETPLTAAQARSSQEWAARHASSGAGRWS